MRAFTHVFVAGPEFAPEAFVCRESVTPPTDTFVWALTVVTPVSVEVSVTEQLPVPPVGVHRDRDAPDGQGRRRVTGDLARSRRAEGDRALAGRVRVRAGGRARAGR